jgi:hypothetical protein
MPTPFSGRDLAPLRCIEADEIYSAGERDASRRPNLGCAIGQHDIRSAMSVNNERRHVRGTNRTFSHAMVPAVITSVSSNAQRNLEHVGSIEAIGGADDTHRSTTSNRPHEPPTRAVFAFDARMNA